MKVKVYLALFALFLFALLYFGLETPSFFPIKKVEVHADFERVSKKEVTNIVSPLIAKGGIRTSSSELEKELTRLTWVKEARVTRLWPNEIKITIVEKKPYARWGETALLSHQGERLLVDDIDRFKSLPLLQGEDGQELLVLGEYKNISQIFSKIGQVVVSYQVSNHFTRSLKLENGVIINLGHQEAEVRLRRFIEVYFAMFHDKFNNISYIDLRYPKGVAVRYREKT